MAISLTYNQQTDVSPAMTPADAQGARYTPAVGEAVESLGNQGARLSADYARIEYMRQHANDVTQLQNNLTQGFEDFDKIGEQLKQEVGPSGVGYAEKLLDKFHPWAQQVLAQQKNPQVQQMAARQLKTMELGLFREARTYEASTTRAWRVGSIESKINGSAALVQKDPTLYEPLMNEDIDTVKSIAGLHPMDSFNLQNKIRNAYGEAAMLADANDRPQWTVNMLTSQKPLPEDSIEQKIVAAAKSNNVNPAVALAIAQYESSMNPNAQNGSSTGLFQLQPSTAKQYGVTDLKNVDENIKGGISDMAANAAAFRAAFKRDPNMAEWYSMHQLGRGAGLALQSAPDNQPFADFANNVYQKQGPKFAQLVQSGNGLGGMTVGQVKQHYAQVMAKAAGETQGAANAPVPGESPAKEEDMPSYFRNATPPQREAMLTHAQNNLRKDNTQEKVQLGSEIKDTLAAYSEGNDAARPDPARVLRTLGPIEGSLVNRQLDGWQDYASKYGQLKLVPYDQQQQILASAKPQPGQGFSDAQERYDRLKTVADKINAARYADPVKFGQMAGTVNKIDWTQPLSFSGPLVARFQQASQAATQFRVPFKAFSDDDVGMIGQMLQHAPAQQAGEIIGQIKGAADSPEHYQQAIAQLAPNHPSYAVAGTLPEIGYAGVQNPSQYILRGEKILHPDKSDKAEEGKAPPILMPEDKPGGFRDLWDKSVGPAFNTSLSSNQYLNAAIAYYVGKQDPAKRSRTLDTALWKEAVNVVAPSVDWNNSKVLVPQGMYAPEFKDTVSKVWPTVMQAYGLDPAEHNAASYPIRNTPDGRYAVTNGTTALYGNNGYPVVFGLDGSVPEMTAPQPPPEPAGKLPKMRDPLQLPMKRSTR